MFFNYFYMLHLLRSSNDIRDRMPFSSSSNAVSFKVFTPFVSNDNLDESNVHLFRYSPPYKIIVHGWTESAQADYVVDMIQIYLRRGNYSIIVMDWSGLASSNYVLAIQNSGIAGKKLASLLLNLRNFGNIDFDDIHIISHSLGAHVSSTAGKKIFKATGEKIGRITGLDPAKPFYEGVGAIGSKGLEESDAEFVDVIHTDGGMFGVTEPRGTVDFYPNGGVAYQPGCEFHSGVWDIVDQLIKYYSCSHKKSHIYYRRSISYPNILAVKCKSWEDFKKKKKCDYDDIITFGEDTPRSASGSYYLAIV